MQYIINFLKQIKWLPCIVLCALSASCAKIDNGEVSEAKLVFRYRFDSTQQRLSKGGDPAALVAGHAAQSPVLHKLAVHYIELMPDASTPLGQGKVLYTGTETSAAGEKAIDYDHTAFFGNYEVFFAVPLKEIPAGEYEWFRMEPASMELSVHCHIDTTITIVTDTSSSTVRLEQDLSGTIASFIGFNTHISTIYLNGQPLTVNDSRKQGYWAFETTISGDGFSEVYTDSGQTAAGSTTVVNPVHASSPVPEGSGVITAAFTPGKLVVTGKETENIIVEVALSNNKSFEWKEIITNGKWDPLKGEPIVDMGLRGMIPSIR